MRISNNLPLNVVLSLAAGVYLGCDSDSTAEPDPLAVVSGTVRASDSGEAVAGATVSVGGKSTTTEDDGQFEVQSAPAPIARGEFRMARQSLDIRHSGIRLL